MYRLTLNFVLYYNGHALVLTLITIKDKQDTLKDCLIKDIKMDPRNPENHLRKYDEKSLEKLQARTIFTDPAYSFIFKKTEKIIAALYLVTNLISDSEPIKWQIRKSALSLMSDILAYRRSPIPESRQVVISLGISISEIISLLKIASISNHVSLMNHSVLQREFALLMSGLDSLNSETAGNGAVALPHDFFNVSVVNSHATGNSSAFSSKGQYRTPFGQKDTQVQSVKKDNLKDSRRDTIIKLLKDGKSLGIKDFAREIKDCGEKTLQRELLSMVESGVLKKIGERRWSLYSLA